MVLVPGVELGHAAAGPACPPDRPSARLPGPADTGPSLPGPSAGRSPRRSAPEAPLRRDAIGPLSAQLVAIVGIPTLGGRPRDRLLRVPLGAWAQVGQPTEPRLLGQEVFEQVGFPHELTERLTPLAVILQDQVPAGGFRAEATDLAGNLVQAQGQRTGPAAMPREDLPRASFRTGGHHQGNQDPVLADAPCEVLELMAWVAINGYA